MPSGIGNGIDITTGATKLPIFAVDYSNNQSTHAFSGHRYIVGKDTSVTELTTSPTTTVQVFEGMYDYIQHLYNFSDNDKVDYLGFYSHNSDLVSVYRYATESLILLVSTSLAEE